MKTQLALIATIALLLTACSYPMRLVGVGSFDSSNLDLGSATAALNSDLQPQALQILSRSCAGCHTESSGPANIYGLTDVNHLISSGMIVPGNPNQSFLMRTIQNGSMPPSGPLSQTDQDILRLWILGGGSPGGGSTPTPGPSPTPTPVPDPSDTQGKALQILSRSCSGCHGATAGSAGVYGLSNVDHMVSSGLIVPGQPDQSRIYTVMRGGSMPPSSPLAQADQDVIRQWIQSEVVTGSNPTPVPTPTPAPTPAPDPSDVQGRALRVLSQRCTACHGETSGSAGVYGLTNVSHLVSSGLIVPGQPDQSRIYTVIRGGSMPPSGPLAQADQDLIRQWIQSEVSTSPNPNPVPAPDPEPTFSYIHSEILIPKCVACHTSGNARGGMNFDTYTGVRRAVDTSRPSRSEIYEVIADGEMPPRPGTPVPSDQRQLILQWIQRGAPND